MPAAQPNRMAQINIAPVDASAFWRRPAVRATVRGLSVVIGIAAGAVAFVFVLMFLLMLALSTGQTSVLN
jgi:hypothetical protein